MNWKPNICASANDRCLVDIICNPDGTTTLARRGWQRVCAVHQAHSDADRLGILISENVDMSRGRSTLAGIIGMEDDAIDFRFDGSRNIELTSPIVIPNRAAAEVAVAAVSPRVRII